MPLSDRHAPEDTVIRRENLDANLQVHTLGRYYPEEYGSQIQASVLVNNLTFCIRTFACILTFFQQTSPKMCT